MAAHIGAAADVPPTVIHPPVPPPTPPPLHDDPAVQWDAVGTAAVARGNQDSLTLSSRLLEILVFLICLLLAHVALAIAPTDADHRRFVADDTRKFVIVALRGVRCFVDDEL